MIEKEIVNRVAKLDVININLSDYAPKNEIVELDLKQFLFKELILKEKEFREGVKSFNINSTPTLLINGKKFEKSLTYKNLKKAIEKLL